MAVYKAKARLIFGFLIAVIGVLFIILMQNSSAEVLQIPDEVMDSCVKMDNPEVVDASLEGQYVWAQGDVKIVFKYFGEGPASVLGVVEGSGFADGDIALIRAGRLKLEDMLIVNYHHRNNLRGAADIVFGTVPADGLLRKEPGCPGPRARWFLCKEVETGVFCHRPYSVPGPGCHRPWTRWQQSSPRPELHGPWRRSLRHHYLPKAIKNVLVCVK